jgi:hypothetical protein
LLFGLPDHVCSIGEGLVARVIIASIFHGATRQLPLPSERSAIFCYAASLGVLPRVQLILVKWPDAANRLNLIARQLLNEDPRMAQPHQIESDP